MKITRRQLRQIIKEQVSDLGNIHADWPGMKGEPEKKVDDLLVLIHALTDGQFTVSEEELNSAIDNISDRIDKIESKLS